MRGKLFNLLLLALLFAAVDSARACSVCYGDTQAPMSKGLTWAITALVIVVGIVLAGVVAFFVRTVRHGETGTDEPISGPAPNQ
jgi:heme/copper-type cytochrome/quinol oxidase subunit 2